MLWVMMVLVMDYYTNDGIIYYLGDGFYKKSYAHNADSTRLHSNTLILLSINRTILKSIVFINDC